MSEQYTVAIYDNMSTVEEAVRMLDQAGFSTAQVSILARGLERESEYEYVSVGEAARRGAITGAGIGGLFGLLVDAASVWVPGFGALLLAVPLAAALLGGFEGAVAGAVGAGMLDKMLGQDIPTQYCLEYAEQLRSGKHLVIIQGSAEEIDTAHHILEGTEAAVSNVHSEVSL
jgi:hypothetical protein